jgi:hypothetical protein
MAVSVTIVLTVPLPSSLIAPLFSNLVLLSYLPLDAAFLSASACYCLILVQGKKGACFFGTIMFSILYFMTWNLKIPGGIVGAWDYAIPSQWSVLQQGGFATLVQTGFGPVIFALVGSLTNLFGFVVGLLAFSLARPVVIAGFSFLVAMQLTSNARIAGLATAMSIVGDPIFILPGDSIYAPLPNGIIFFLVGTYLLLRFRRSSSAKSEILSAIIVATATLEYPLAAVLLVGEALIVQLQARVSPRLGLESLITFSSIFVAWNIFTGSAALLIQQWGSAIFQGIGKTSTSYHSSELLTHLHSFLGNQPAVLVSFSIGWMLIVFGAGTIFWLYAIIGGRRSTAVFALPMYVVAIPLLLTQGGYAEYRVFFYLGIFLSVLMLMILKNRKVTIVGIILTVTLTALPTLASTLPQVGFNSSEFPTSYAAGNFLHLSPRPATLFTISGVMAFDYVYPSSYLAPEALHYTNGSEYARLVRSFSAGVCGPDSCQFFDISSIYFASVGYQFGSETSSQLRQSLSVQLTSYNLIYSNSVTEIFW